MQSAPDKRQFFRRAHPNQVIKDKETGLWRVSSAAFRDPHLSCDDEQILNDEGLDYSFCLKNHPEHSLVKFPAEAVIKLGLIIVANPIPGNTAHTLIEGKKSGGIPAELQKSSIPILIRPGTSQ